MQVNTLQHHNPPSPMDGVTNEQSTGIKVEVSLNYFLLLIILNVYTLIAA